MISILCPTRNRPDSLRRLISSAEQNADGTVEFVLYCDDDAPPPEDIRTSNVIIVTGPRITLSQMWNECQKAATYEIYMHCGDDIVFRSEHWDTYIKETFDKYPDHIVMVHGDAGDYGAAFGTHNFLHKRWVDIIGYFTPPYFVSDYADTWLNEVANALGRRVYDPRVITEHMHPLFGKGPLDQTHLERLERHQADDPGAIYVSTADKRQQDIAKLRAVMQ